MQPDPFDLVILGAGPGGVTAAKAAAIGGLRVALVGADPILGYGLEGAYKSKALWEVAREYHIVRSRWGLTPSAGALDMAGISAAGRAGAEDLRGVHLGELTRLGVSFIAGRGRFLDPHTIAVGDRRLHGAHVIVATGTRPRSLPFAPVDGVRILNSDHVVDPERVPASLLVLGAGVIGCEFASIYAALGARVHLLDTRARILSHEDPDISALLARSFERLGVRILPEARCTRIEPGDPVRTHLADGTVIETAQVLLAVGRTPNTDDLDLAAAGVEPDGWGYVPTCPDMRSNVPHIYAVGDVGLRDTSLDLNLVHVAEAEARRAVAAILGRRKRADMNHVPFLVFTLPMIAGAGDNETSARERLGDVRVGKYANVRNHRSHARGQRSGFVKLIVGPKGDDRVLGVRAVGDGVDTVVGEVSLMIQNQLPYTHLLDAIHAHPSLSESLHGAALIVCRRALGYEEGEEFGADFWIG